MRFELDLSPRQSDLVAEPVDFVIRIGRPAESHLVQRKLTEVPVGLFASPGYLERHGAPVDAAGLGGHTVLSVLGRDLQLTRISDGTVVRFTPRAPVVMNTLGWLKRFALQGQGLASLSPEMIRPELAAGRLVPVLADWTQPPIEVHVLTESRLLPARVRLFLDYLIAHIDMGQMSGP